MIYNVFGGTLNLAQSNPIRGVTVWNLSWNKTAEQTVRTQRINYEMYNGA